MPPCPRGLCPQAPPRGFSRALAFLGSASPGAAPRGVRLSHRGTPWTRRHRFSSRPSLPSPRPPRPPAPAGRAHPRAAWPDPWPPARSAVFHSLSLVTARSNQRPCGKRFHLLKRHVFFQQDFFICFIAIFQSRTQERKVFRSFPGGALLSCSVAFSPGSWPGVGRGQTSGTMPRPWSLQSRSPRHGTRDGLRWPTGLAKGKGPQDTKTFT